MTGSVIGTYLHGPVLPRNPALADHLIVQALRRHDSSVVLQPLADVDLVDRMRIVRRARWRHSRPRLSSRATG